ncbi:MAG TPA: GIY-YIG nuclease family protein, partial [Gemmatimonadales bacterium]|nr:GIY-YIG nuclease family protein [Gemmatimonadales bacterium]
MKRARRAQQVAPIPSTDLEQLRRRVRALAENRPAVYRMVDAAGKIIYVGKAKRLRTRLLTYFRAEYPEDKAARILYAAQDIAWEYVPSEFAAYLGELRQIRRYRPHFNYRGNVTRRSVLIKVSGGPAPRVYAGSAVSRDDLRCYGPFRSLGRTLEAVRTLNDLLGLRDCPSAMPTVFAGQRDLFDEPRQAGCMRYEFGFCSGPCAGFVSEWEYRRRVETATAFLEGRTIQPLDRVIGAMQEASADARFEVAARWREKFE